jgi:subtilisin family serine protease
MGGGDPLYPLQPSARYWHLSDIHALTTGRHVRVAVVDSAIDAAHPDLAGQVVDAQDFVEDGRHVAEAHGTAVAGIIAAKSDNGMGIAGIAPNARLVGMRACWEVAADDTECNSFTLGKALHAVLLKDVQVINLSLSGPPDLLVARLLDAALARNIKIVAAADPHSADSGFPATHPGVLAVGDETTRTGMDSGSQMLLAPGRDIPTTLPGARWDFVSGASYAAAHVSGLIALLTELRPAMPSGQMRRAIAAAPSDGLAAAVDPCATFLRLTATCACHPCLTSHTAEAHH